MIEIPFVGQSYNMDSLDISAQRCVNMYPEVYEDGKTKTVTSLRPTHGLSLFATQSGVNQMRGLYLASTNKFFGVRGNQVSTFDTAGSETTRFTLNSGLLTNDNAIVRMADNGTTMLIVDGTANAYTYTLATDTATKVTDADFPSASFVVV